RKLFDSDRRRNELRAITCQSPPHIRDPVALGHGPADHLDVLLTKSGNDANPCVTACPMPGDGVVHFFQTKDERSALAMERVIDNVQLLSSHVSLSLLLMRL